MDSLPREARPAARAVANAAGSLHEQSPRLPAGLAWAGPAARPFGHVVAAGYPSPDPACRRGDATGPAGILAAQPAFMPAPKNIAALTMGISDTSWNRPLTM